MLTIVMYHYVRDLPRTRYPRIKGLLTCDFEGQLEYIDRHYTVCSLAQVCAAAAGDHELPPNACILTFDDGLADHYDTVFKRLLDRGLTGVFFPPARPIEEHCILDVHKVHFILAAVADHGALTRELFQRIAGHRDRFDIPSGDELWRRFAVASRFDPAEVVFIKRMLQWVLPRQVRAEIAAELFARYVSEDEAGFAAELYVTMSQLREMAGCGMEIGGHGYEHLWLGELTREEQAGEIRRTVSFLAEVFGREPQNWYMSYPFGSYNSDTLALLSEAACAAGVTSKTGLANPAQLLELARLDTLDLPFGA